MPSHPDSGIVRDPFQFLVGVAALIALVLLARLVATVIVFGGAILIIILLIFEFSTGERPTIGEAERLIDRDTPEEVDQIRRKLLALMERRNETIRHGLAIPLVTRNSDPKRFDERSVIAKRVNRQLDGYEKEYLELNDNLEKLVEPIKGGLYDWQQRTDRWCKDASVRVGLRLAVATYAMVYLTSLIQKPKWLEGIGNWLTGAIFFSHPSIADYYGPSAVASCAAVLVGIFGWKLCRHLLRDCPNEKPPRSDALFYPLISKEEFEVIGWPE